MIKREKKRELAFELLAESARCDQRFERRIDNLRGARTIRVVAGFDCEEFSVGEDHAQLVIQAMKEGAKIGALGSCSIFGHVLGRRHYAAGGADCIRSPSG